MAHFALQKLYILPSVLDDMDNREKSLVYASIQLRIEDEKKHAPKNRTKRGGRRRYGNLKSYV